MGSSGKLWQVVVGLEIHAQIQSATKLFSGAPTAAAFLEKNDLGVCRPNENVSLFDAALPGTLPALNRHCVHQAVRTSLALQGTVHRRSTFERKHYFYCDLPAGYQITQNSAPLMTDGFVSFPVHYSLPLDSTNGSTDGSPVAPEFSPPEGVSQVSGTVDSEPALGCSATGPGPVMKTVKIKQLQLEQDSGKSIHDIDPRCTFVDLNRAGTALMEIVTAPDMYSGEEATSCVRTLQEMLRSLRTCDGRMESGSMRVDVNVSVRPVKPIPESPESTPVGAADDTPDKEVAVGGSESGSSRWITSTENPWPLDPHRAEGGRVEIKNLNSVKSVLQAIEYEAQRHVDILDRCDDAPYRDDDGRVKVGNACSETSQEPAAKKHHGEGRARGPDIMGPVVPVVPAVSNIPAIPAIPVIPTETRLFDAAAGLTVTMRSKEDDMDYRFMPEPDLNALIVEPDLVESIRRTLPELPGAMRARLRREYRLSVQDADVLIGEPGAVAYYERAVHALHQAREGREGHEGGRGQQWG